MYLLVGTLEEGELSLSHAFCDPTKKIKTILTSSVCYLSSIPISVISK
jgi:hypothetical protein